MKLRNYEIFQKARLLRADNYSHLSESRGNLFQSRVTHKWPAGR